MDSGGIHFFMKKIARFVLRHLYIPDIGFFSTLLLLTGLGLVMVYSASGVMALDRYNDTWFFLKRQAAFVGVGLFLMMAISATDYRRVVKAGGWVLIVAIIGLILTLIPGLGANVNGAQRWLNVAGIRIQIAEFTKIALILYMTWALVRKGDQVRSFTYGILPMGVVTLVISGLLMKQPDFGNTVVLILIAGTLIFLAGGRIGYLVGAVLCCVPVTYFLIMGAAYRKRRLLAFLNPWDDPQNTSYQIVQSFTAFFSGGLLGTGLGNSKEKLYYLPEVHTDFIMSVVGEELGFIGVFGTILCFGFLILRGFRIALRASDPTGFLLAAGCSTLLGYQIILNLCVVMGLVPTKGLPLPFLSHGGSALIATFIACGLIQSVGRRAHMQGALKNSPWIKHWGELQQQYHA